MSLARRFLQMVMIANEYQHTITLERIKQFKQDLEWPVEALTSEQITSIEIKQISQLPELLIKARIIFPPFFVVLCPTSLPFSAIAFAGAQRWAKRTYELRSLSLGA